MEENENKTTIKNMYAVTEFELFSKKLKNFRNFLPFFLLISSENIKHFQLNVNCEIYHIADRTKMVFPRIKMSLVSN